MVNINIKTKVISLPDHDGIDRIAEFLKHMGAKAEGSHESKVKIAFILKAIDLMQYVDFSDLPTGEKPFYETIEIEVDEKMYRHTFELIKPLRKEPIFELRLNMREFNWRFRATFFPIGYGDNYYCFVHPFEKVKGEPDLTNRLRDFTFSIYHAIVHNPDRYRELFE